MSRPCSGEKKRVHLNATISPELNEKLKEKAPNGGKSKLVEKILKKHLMMM
jgi:hypothetical protein